MIPSFDELFLLLSFNVKKHIYLTISLLIQVRLVRLKKRSGLIRARLTGARLATGDSLLFLDSHCECGDDWIEPLLQRIKEEPRAFVVPIIDVIDDKTMEYYHGNGAYFQVWIFLFPRFVGFLKMMIDTIWFYSRLWQK